jgi:hypothetical protein
MPNFPSLGRREYLIAAVGGAGLVVFAFLVFVLAEWVGEWVGRRDCPGCKPDEIAKAISDARTALLQIIVGVAGAAALYFTWQNYVLSREGRTSDNFIKAVDQLGNKAVHARTGGVVGVGRLLRTAKAEGDYWPLMDVLTAFVRQSAPVGQTPRAKKAPEDVQAAIDVIARRELTYLPPRTGNSPVDLHQSDLSELWMAGGHYEGGHFVDSVLVRTDLTDAKLEGANFERANLSKAIFKKADLKGVSFEDATIYDADFTGATVDENTKLASARGNSGTKLPNGVQRPGNWT